MDVVSDWDCLCNFDNLFRYIFDQNRNSTVIGWLTNLDLLALLVLLTQSFELIGQKYYALVLAVALIVVGLAVILGLILSFVFLFVNAIVVWRKEGYSLSGSLTLIAGVGVVLVDILIFSIQLTRRRPFRLSS